MVLTDSITYPNSHTDPNSFFKGYLNGEKIFEGSGYDGSLVEEKFCVGSDSTVETSVPSSDPSASPTVARKASKKRAKRKRAKKLKRQEHLLNV